MNRYREQSGMFNDFIHQTKAGVLHESSSQFRSINDSIEVFYVFKIESNKGHVS